MFKNRQGISLIFSIIVVTALLITTVTLNEVIIRNVQRVSEMSSILQAQSSANSAFEEALVYISENCEAGCNTSGTITIDAGDTTTWAEYEVFGESETNDDGYYYVPAPGLGNAASECTLVTDAGDACNWNRIYYGESASIPLYIDGENTFDGTVLEVKVRTANGGNILCSDRTETDTQNSCDLDNDPVLIHWQIQGNRTDESNYIEAIEVLGWTLKRSSTDSERHTTLINSVKNSGYTVVNIEDISNPNPPSDTIYDALTDATDPLTSPVLELSFIQSVTDADETPISYLEYQIKTDTPISSNHSYITVIGYTENQDNTYFWSKEGWWSQYSSSPINFAFQN